MRQSHCRRSLTSSLVSSCYVDWYKTANLSHQPIRGSPSRQRFCPSSPKIATPMTNVDTIHGRRPSTPNHPATQTPEGDSSRRDAEARRARLPSLSASATQREFLPPIPTSRASHKLDQPDPGAGARSTPVLIPPSPAPKVRTMPAYCIAIGIGHRHEWRAEGPVSSPGSVREPIGRAFSPRINHLPTKTLAAGQGWYHAAPLALKNVGMVLRLAIQERSVREGSHPRLVQGSHPRLVRGPTARPDISLWHRHRNWAPR